jgi:cytochrome c1
MSETDKDLPSNSGQRQSARLSISSASATADHETATSLAHFAETGDEWDLAAAAIDFAGIERKAAEDLKKQRSLEAQADEYVRQLEESRHGTGTAALAAPGLAGHDNRATEVNSVATRSLGSPHSAVAPPQCVECMYAMPYCVSS